MAEPVYLNDGWVKSLDPGGSGNYYYANTGTGETAWSCPPGCIDPDAPAAAPAEAAAPAGGALPEGWVEALDPGSGRSYYVHAASGTTSWEHPGSAAAPDAGAGAGAATAAASAGLSGDVLAAWKSVLTAARAEASHRIGEKNKKFAGLRGFAAVAAKRKEEAAKKKAEEAEAEAAAERAGALGDAARSKRSILSFLELEVPAVEKKDIEAYAGDWFNLDRKGFFGGKSTVSKMLTWKNEQIKKALHKGPVGVGDFDSFATQTFRNIMGFMGDRSSGKEDSGHAEKLLKTCLNASTEHRDEVFCQVIKQTTGNPSPESTLKGWQLLGVISGVFNPGSVFESYLLSHCDAHKEDGGGVGDYAKYTLGRLKKTSALGPRRETPTAMEIEACKERQPVLVRVYHVDGSFDTMPVTSWTTPPLLKAMVCEKRGIAKGDAFAIYEMTPAAEERFLGDDERVLDIVSYWQRLSEEEKSKVDDKKKAKKTNDFYRLVFKVAMYFEPLAEDRPAVHEMFIQAVYDVVTARYPCGEKDCVFLAGLQLQAEFGDAGLAELPAKLARFMPTKYAESTRVAEIAADIRKAHAAHKGKSAWVVSNEYLNYVKDWQVYGSSFFFVEPQMNADLPEDCFLAVNPKGVLLINPDTKEVLATHLYSEIPTWGHSGTSFVLHIGNLIKQTKLYFSTEQGKDINDLVRSYVNHLCAS